jgi:RHS repeat-associated protein
MRATPHLPASGRTANGSRARMPCGHPKRDLSETGLHYNWHRSYDPTLGRYTQPDPLGFVDGPSVYAYAGGLPQGKIDFDGRQATAVSTGIVTAVITAGIIKAAKYCAPKILRAFSSTPANHNDPKLAEKCPLSNENELPDGGRNCVYRCPSMGVQFRRTTPAYPVCHPYIVSTNY